MKKYFFTICFLGLVSALSSQERRTENNGNLVLEDIPAIPKSIKENLSKFIDMGVDLVAFSGGKGIQGPQSTGFLVGVKELVEAAHPEVTKPFSALHILATKSPADLLSFIISTKTDEASFIADKTSGFISEPPSTVTQL